MFTFILIAVLLLWLLYKKLTGKFKMFADRGVKFDDPVVVFGNAFSVAKGKEHALCIIERLYNKFYSEKVFGFFNMGVPNFVITDADLIKQITIKDFDSFLNHDKTFDETVDKLIGKSLFMMFDDRWRNMRNSLSPIFTSSKMKMMFGILTEGAQDVINHFDKKSKSEKIIVDVKDIFARYTVDGISTAALGIKGDCIENEDSELYKMALGMSSIDKLSSMKILLSTISKPLYKLLGFQVISKKYADFFERTIVDVMDERDQKGTFRPDVVQLLLQMKKGQLDNREKSDDKDFSNFSANIEYDAGGKSRALVWEKQDFMAQGFIFFSAGFDTTQNLLQMTAYELARNRDIQQELIEEVDEVVSTLNGKPVTYEALHKMKFLDQVISESLRFHAPVKFTNRECSKDYMLDVGNEKSVIIKKGENVLIPIESIHRDEKYFENAYKFDPHRFDDNRKDSIKPGSFIPFGYGPRVCIGSRFALMEAKLIIFNILTKFSIEVCDKTPTKIEYVPSLFAFERKEKIFVEFKRRN